VWIHSLHLHIEHKNILQQKVWLDDVIINAGHNLLRNRFPDGGLHCTLTVAARKCDTLCNSNHAHPIKSLGVQRRHVICLSIQQQITNNTIISYRSNS